MPPVGESISQRNVTVRGAAYFSGSETVTVTRHVWASAGLAVMPPATLAASAATSAGVTGSGGALLSWQTAASTDLPNAGVPAASPYCDVIVDQLSAVVPRLGRNTRGECCTSLSRSRYRGKTDAQVRTHSSHRATVRAECTEFRQAVLTRAPVLVT
jgi:hypothetical protein